MSSNDSTRLFCEDYIRNSSVLDYAIMLKGPWGCGKTYFINELMEQYITTKNITYISLYGVRTIDEIKNKILETIMGKENTKVVTFGLKLLTPLAASISKADFIAPIIEASKEALLERKKGTNNIFIIDDFERTNLTSNEIFVFFSPFIIDEGVKIIFIGNEEEMKCNKYKTIKEKIIGYTFEIQPEIELVIKESLNQINMKNILEIVQKVCGTLEVTNIRIIKRAIGYLEYIIKHIELLKDEDKYLNEFIETYLILYFQYHKGELIDEKDKKLNKIFIEAIYSYHRYNLSYKVHKERYKDSKDLFKYYYRWIPFKDSWEQIIVNGNIDKNFLKNRIMIDLREFKPKEQDELRYLLENWGNIAYEIFKDKFKNLKMSLVEGKFVAVEDLLTIYDFVDFLNKNRIVRDRPISIINLAKKFKKNFINIPQFNRTLFHEVETEEYKKIRKELIDIAKINKIEKTAEDLNIKMNNFELFIKDLAGGFKYLEGYEQYHIPILKYLDNEKLINGLKNTDVKIKIIFVDSLITRYGINENDIRGKLYLFEEFEMLKKLSQVFLIKKTERTLYNPTIIRKKQISDKYVEILEYLEKKKAEFSI